MLYLVALYYGDYCYIVPYLIFFIMIWLFFIRSNFMNTRVRASSKDNLTPSTVIKKQHYSVFINWSLIHLCLLYICIYSTKGVSKTFLWNQFYLSNFVLNITNLILLLLILMFMLFKTLTNNNVNYSTDFFFSILNVTIFLSLIFYTNTIFSFIFILELNSISIFYKFVTSRYWYKNNDSLEPDKSDIVNKNVPKNYLNMLFFQYWSTFFSSILIFFSLCNIYSLYGSSEFFAVDLLNWIASNTQYNNTRFILIIWVPLILGILIKIGITPFHLFKIEVYKGLPLVSILFYTTFYFFVYFIFFVLFLSVHLTFIKIIITSLFYISIILGLLYIVSLLFDITALKSFFAYSTIINSLLFITASILL